MRAYEDIESPRKTPFCDIEAYFKPDVVSDELARASSWAMDTREPKAIETAYALNIGVLSVCRWLCRLPGPVVIYDDGEYYQASPLVLVEEYVRCCRRWLDRLNGEFKGAAADADAVGPKMEKRGDDEE